MKKYNLLLLFSFIISLELVSSISPQGDISVQFSVNNLTSASNWKTTSWICEDYEVYKTYGSSDDTWGLSNLTESNFSDSIFQVVINASKVQLVNQLRADHVQVRIYYTILGFNVAFISPTPANNSIESSTIVFNATSELTPIANCVLQNNRNGSYVNDSMTINGDNCFLTLKGISNSIFFYSVIVVLDTGSIGRSETRNISVRNNPTSIILNNPLNNSLGLNASLLLNWTVNNTENDYLIVRGFIAQNTTANITKQIFYWDNGLFNQSFTYNFTNMVTPINKTQQLWALYKFDNNSEVGEGGNYVFDHSENNKNAVHSTLKNITEGKFVKGAFHKGGSSTIDDITSASNNYANISVNGMSINAWVDFKKLGAGGILQRWDTINDDRFFYLLKTAANKLNFVISYNGNATDCSVVGPTSISSNTWHMITATFNKTETRVYLNGVFEANKTCSFNGINQTAWQDNENLRIGLAANTGMNGTVDELGFWNTSLSAQEVSDLYNLKNDTYYWYLESNEYNATNSRVNSSLFQFTIGSAVTDTCSYTSGNWDLKCSDNCTYNSNTNIAGNVSISGSGNITFFSGGIWNFTTTGNYVFINESLGNACYIYTYSGGGWNR